MKLFLDVTRVSTRIFRSSPTGIDRAEFAYAQEMISRLDDDIFAIITTPFFSGAIPRRRLEDILTRLQTVWGLHRGLQNDCVFRDIRGWLTHPPEFSARHPPRFRASTKSLPSLIRDAKFPPAHDLMGSPARLARLTARYRLDPTVYFHSSHTQLDNPQRFGWLNDGNIRSVFFVHDLIPLEYPELCSPSSYIRHSSLLRTVSEFASTIVVTSRASERSVRNALAQRRLRQPKIEVIPLAVDAWFLDRARLEPPKPEAPYFLVVGAIEPRRNLAFLLTIWRLLVERHGADVPRLVIAGRRGRENENIVDVLERSRMLAPFVAEASDLTDAGLASLMAGATALLAPSLVEGCSLPLAQALATAAPVVASDIPVHREAAGEAAIYRDPIDGLAWMQAVEELARPNSARRREAQARAASFQPVTWSDHLRAVTDTLERAVAGPSRTSGDGRVRQFDPEIREIA